MGFAEHFGLCLLELLVLYLTFSSYHFWDNFMKNAVKIWMYKAISIALILMLCFFAAPIQFKFSVLQLNWNYNWWCVTKHLLGNYFLWDYFKRNIVKSCAYLFDWLMNIKIKFEFWYIFLILIECDPFFFKLSYGLSHWFHLNINIP